MLRPARLLWRNPAAYVGGPKLCVVCLIFLLLAFAPKGKPYGIAQIGIFLAMPVRPFQNHDFGRQQIVRVIREVRMAD